MQPVKLTTRIERLTLRSLNQLGAEAGQRNARAMTQATYKRLVENIRRDGVLTSTPLVGRMEGDKRLFVISGNHRVAAAIEASIEEAECMVIVEPISRQRFTAIQLSHNAIEGNDDATILQELYEILDLDLKEYSGLTDDDFGANDLSVLSLSAIALLYTEIVLGFLADDAGAVDGFMKSAERWAKKSRPMLVSAHAQFDGFFEAIVRVKGLKNVHNSALAMALLVELANERMDELAAEQAA